MSFGLNSAASNMPSGWGNNCNKCAIMVNKPPSQKSLGDPTQRIMKCSGVKSQHRDFIITRIYTNAQIPALFTQHPNLDFRGCFPYSEISQMEKCWLIKEMVNLSCLKKLNPISESLGEYRDGYCRVLNS